MSDTKLIKGNDSDKIDDHIRKHEAPVDKNKVVYLLCVLYGIGGLMPWNSVLTAMDFFITRVSIFPHPQLDPYEMAFTTTLIVNTPNFLLQLPLIKWGNKVSLKNRMLFAYFFITIITAVLPFLTESLSKGAD